MFTVLRVEGSWVFWGSSARRASGLGVEGVVFFFLFFFEGVVFFFFF